jgi:hypothetical protein
LTRGGRTISLVMLDPSDLRPIGPDEVHQALSVKAPRGQPKQTGGEVHVPMLGVGRRSCHVRPGAVLPWRMNTLPLAGDKTSDRLEPVGCP